MVTGGGLQTDGGADQGQAERGAPQGRGGEGEEEDGNPLLSGEAGGRPGQEVRRAVRPDPAGHDGGAGQVAGAQRSRRPQE